MRKLLALLFALLAAPVGAQVIPSGPVGSLNYWGVGGLSQVLNPGLAGQCLTTQGVGSAPVWVNCQVSSLSLLPPINTNQFYGNVSGQFSPPVGVDVNTILNTVGYDIARPPPVESIIYKSNVGPLFNWQALFPGAQGQLLTSGGPTNPPFWSPSPTQSNLASICQTVGALLYFNTPSNLWACLNPGTAGQVLQTGGAGANPSYLTLSGVAPITYSNGTIGVTAAALTSTNDTNVTATLGGTPTTALLQPTSITMGWTGTLAIGRGGTGAGTASTGFNNLAPTPTRAGDVIYWNGSTYTTVAGNNSGTNCLQENASGVPSFAACASGVVSSFNTLTGAVTTSVVVQTFSASGTYTPTAGMLHAIIECIGPGGGGGGTASAAASTFSQGAGGGAGGYSRKYVTAATVGASQTVTVGTGGSAGASGANNGGNGSAATSVGTLCVANAGSGGTGSAGTSNSLQAGGAGGAAGTGDVAGVGQSGVPTITQAGPVPTFGGSTLLGAGGNTPFTLTALTGSAGSGCGAGGGGGRSVNGGAAMAGGAGSNGCVIITEFVNL